MRQKLILIVSTILLSTISYAQINGNGKLTSTTVSTIGLEEIDIQFNANITLDYNSFETMTITADENIMPYIGKNFENGKLTLDQIKWIEPSSKPKITIGVPNLKKIYQGTHSSTSIINLNSSQLAINGNVGNVTVSGSCQELIVDVRGTDVDLSNTAIDLADIIINGNSTVKIDKVNKLMTKLEGQANLVLLSEPKEYLENSQVEIKEKNTQYKSNPNLKYIAFTIKNNSWSRNHFVVVGPKKNGDTFSYGFPMMPGFSKSEKWSVGTKIYKEGKLGSRELLVTIKEDDEGQIVKLF